MAPSFPAAVVGTTLTALAFIAPRSISALQYDALAQKPVQNMMANGISQEAVESIKPGPWYAEESQGVAFQLPDILADKILRISTLVQSVTKTGLDVSTLAAVSPTADKDHVRAHLLNVKILNGQKVTLEEILDLMELLSKSQTAESAAANNVLLTARDISMLMGGFKGEEFGTNYSVEGGKKNFATFQGDILTDSDNTAWKNSNVKYCFAEDISPRVKKAFKAATKRYNRAVPCLRFEEVGWKSGKSESIREYMQCEEHPAIFVTSNPAYGCFSHRGMVQEGRSQQLQLNDPGCTLVGTVMHELGHALGLGHAVPDASTQILSNSVESGKGKNFEFDFDEDTSAWNNSLSIMHYDAYAFSADSKHPTMDGPDAKVLGQRVGLAIADVAALSALYRHQSAECVRSGLAGFGSVENYTIQCYQGADCPGKELFIVNDTNDTLGEDDMVVENATKHNPNVWDQIKGVFR